MFIFRHEIYLFFTFLYLSIEAIGLKAHYDIIIAIN